MATRDTAALQTTFVWLVWLALVVTVLEVGVWAWWRWTVLLWQALESLR